MVIGWFKILYESARDVVSLYIFTEFPYRYHPIAIR